DAVAVAQRHHGAVVAGCAVGVAVGEVEDRAAEGRPLGGHGRREAVGRQRRVGDAERAGGGAGGRGAGGGGGNAERGVARVLGIGVAAEHVEAAASVADHLHIGGIGGAGLRRAVSPGHGGREVGGGGGAVGVGEVEQHDAPGGLPLCGAGRRQGTGRQGRVGHAGGRAGEGRGGGHVVGRGGAEG